MFELLSINECCGCMACVNACPKNIISVKKDKLGFAYPFLTDPDKCINCNRCNDVCPNKKERTVSTNVGEVLCAYNKDETERVFSSSGGIFPLLCKSVLRNGGVCYGVGFKDDFQTQFVRVDRIEELKSILSSKYAEAEKGYVFRQVMRDLIDGKPVLFSGSPCQVYGLKSFLNKDYSNLLLVDLFCYGIPSPEIWKRWLFHISNGKKPVFVDFRDKTRGWDNYSLRVDFADGTKYCEPKARDLYIATFSKGAFIRPSCYQCKLKAFPRASDITLGDFQELKELFPDADPHAGWSMVRLNTLKGRSLFKNISDEVEYTVIEAERMDSIHPGIGRPSTMHPNRITIEEKAESIEVNQLLKRYATPTFKMRFNLQVYKMKRIIKRVLKK